MSDKRPSVTRVVKYIRKGVGISYTNVEYADSTSNSVAPTSGWKTTAPAWQNGHYIWQRVHIVYTDGTDGYSNPVCLSGGKGISKIEEYYLATSSASGVTTSTSGWTKAIQSVTAEKKYLWNYEVVTYTDGTNTVTTPVIIGVYGDKGVGVSSITEHYLATSASSGVTRSTTGWTTSIQTVTNAKKYLWNYETVTYTDGSTADTDPVIIGVYGDTGNGVNPNILLRTIFDNGISPVKEVWTADWSYTRIDTATDTVVQGRKSVRINAYGLSHDLNFSQNVYGRIKTSTWYTLSFCYFATEQFRTFLWDGANTYGIVDRYAGFYVDGVLHSEDFGIDGSWIWPSEWQGKRHTVTFKTKSSFGTSQANILFRVYSGGQVAICMPKLEEGKEATAYIAHESDLKGDPGDPGSPGGQGPRGYRGPGLRGPQDWALMDIDYQFYKGDESTQEPYEDFVVYDGNYYKCVKSHTKTSYNYPDSTADTSNGYWQLSDKLAMVAANVLFAKHGYFGSAIISGDWMISTNGMIDNTFCENGATYQGIIAYSLFNENNPSGDDVLIYGSSTTQTKTASETTKTIATVSLEAGKLYYLKATGKAGSASGQYYIRIRNTSTGTTNTPVMINGTSNVTRSGYFSPGTTGSYYLEFYDTSGISAEVSAIELTRKDFAPTFALDLLTGTTYQHDGVFTGFIRKGKTKITTSNIGNYKRTDITEATVLDFDKCGSFIELSTGTASYFSLPLLSSAIASKYTAAQKDRIRSFIGTKLLVYNYSGVNLSITWKWTASGGTYGYTLYNGNCVELECKMDKDDGDNGTEVIYWEINKTAAPV